MARPLRIGHKGADALALGNTIESFEAAVEVGVDVIELDVLRSREGRFVIAHDYADAASRPALDLRTALDAFRHPPLDRVEINCDVKLAGREPELAGALAGAGMLDRAMVSTMEIETLVALRGLEPELRLGLTFPKTRVDWPSKPWAAPMLGVGLAAMQRRYPKLLPRRAEQLGLSSTWVFHRVITPSLIEVARSIGVQVMAWTVDDPQRIAELTEMGVDGICSNDPRLLNGQPEPEPDAKAEPDADSKPDAGAEPDGKEDGEPDTGTDTGAEAEDADARKAPEPAPDPAS